MNWKSLIGNVVTGFFAAVIIDVNAWSKSSEPFNWKLAFKRWISGALTGVTVGGGSQMFPDLEI